MDALIQSGLASGLFYGAEVLVARRGGVPLHRAYGTYNGTRPLEKDSVFDIASLTKPVATASLLLALGLPLESKVCAYLPAFSGGDKGQVTLRQLAAHSAGLPPTVRFSNVCTTRAEARAALLAVPLAQPPGQRVVYSCLGYMLLGEVLEAASGQPLAALFSTRIAGPVGMAASGYTPLQTALNPARLVPAKPAPARAGLVHDSNAGVFGGSAGNAGLFSTARDLHRFARMVLEGGHRGGRAIIPAHRLAAFFQNQSPTGQPARSLGWELKGAANTPPSCGPDFPDGAIGHTGFTGTAMWLEPKTGLIAILLANRTAISHSGTLEDMQRFRHRFFKLAAARPLL